MGLPPSFTGANWTLLIPWATPVCCSPDTSMTSRVSSSQGIRGNVMLRWISIFSPVAEQSISKFIRVQLLDWCYLFPCQLSTQDAPPPACNLTTRPRPSRTQSAVKLSWRYLQRLFESAHLPQFSWMRPGELIGISQASWHRNIRKNRSSQRWAYKATTSCACIYTTRSGQLFEDKRA